MRRRTTKKRRQQELLDDTVRAIVCSLRGVDCYLWFDEDGELHGAGPKEVRRGLEIILVPLHSLDEINKGY